MNTISEVTSMLSNFITQTAQVVAPGASTENPVVLGMFLIFQLCLLVIFVSNSIKVIGRLNPKHGKPISLSPSWWLFQIIATTYFGSVTVFILNKHPTLLDGDGMFVLIYLILTFLVITGSIVYAVHLKKKIAIKQQQALYQLDYDLGMMYYVHSKGEKLISFKDFSMTKVKGVWVKFDLRADALLCYVGNDTDPMVFQTMVFDFTQSQFDPRLVR